MDDKKKFSDLWSEAAEFNTQFRYGIHALLTFGEGMDGEDEREGLYFISNCLFENNEKFRAYLDTLRKER